MRGMILQVNQTIQNNQLHIIICFLYNQFHVTLRSSSVESRKNSVKQNPCGSRSALNTPVDDQKIAR